MPVFIKFQGYPSHVDKNYEGRIELSSHASIELSDIRLSDEGWYECNIVFMSSEGEEDYSTNGTWIYLSVNREYRTQFKNILLCCIT